MKRPSRGHLLAAPLLLCAGCGGQAETGDAPPATESAAVVDTAAARPRSQEELLREALNLPNEGTFQTLGDRVVAADLGKTSVADLSPLSGTRLRSLDIHATPVKDIAPLRGLPLESLFAEQTAVTDISPLEGMPLKQLYLSEASVADIAALAGMRLKELNLVDTPVSDITPLATTEIGSLWLRRTKVTDLSPLADRGVVSLDVGETAVSDLSPLSRMRSLRRLHIAETDVTDLTPIADLPLERLVFTPSKITAGLDAVRANPTIKQLGVRFEMQDDVMPPAAFWAKVDAGEF